MADSPALRFLVRKRTTFTWLVPLALLAATFRYGHWNLIAFVVGALFLVLGEIVRFWAAGTIQKDNVIATTGPYALVRNPLYLGSLFLAVGFTLMSGLGLIAWIVVIGFFFLFHCAAIISEQRFLISKFGEPYEAYLRSGVPALIPFPKFSAAVSEGRFSPKQALYNREHITAAITFVTALLFAVVHFAHHTVSVAS